jgi:hypothetical protein
MTPLELGQQLWDQTHPRDRCPYLGRDEGGCFCSSPLFPAWAGKDARRGPCGTASLQL